MAYNKRSMVTKFAIPSQTPSAAPVTNYGYNAKPDAAATVQAAGFFNIARDDGRLAVDDIIDVYLAGDFLRLIVTAVPAAPGNVTVAVNTAAAGA